MGVLCGCCGGVMWCCGGNQECWRGRQMKTTWCEALSLGILGKNIWGVGGKRPSGPPSYPYIKFAIWRLKKLRKFPNIKKRRGSYFCLVKKLQNRIIKVKNK